MSCRNCRLSLGAPDPDNLEQRYLLCTSCAFLLADKYLNLKKALELEVDPYDILPPWHPDNVATLSAKGVTYGEKKED